MPYLGTGAVLVFSTRSLRKDLKIQKIEIKKAKFGSSVYKPCKGNQRETWGGYAKRIDLRPKVPRKVLEPNWRGRFSGGSRKDRHFAHGEVTEAELAGDVDPDLKY